MFISRLRQKQEGMGKYPPGKYPMLPEIPWFKSSIGMVIRIIVELFLRGLSYQGDRNKMNGCGLASIPLDPFIPYCHGLIFPESVKFSGLAGTEYVVLK